MTSHGSGDRPLRNIEISMVGGVGGGGMLPDSEAV